VFILDDVERAVSRLELPFSRFGIDPYGVSRWHLRMFLSWLGWLYRYYFRVHVHGIENVPRRGRGMLVGNHSGGVALDGAMVLASCLLDLDPPRLAQGMAEKFLNRWPFAAEWSYRTGQFTGLPEHAVRLLEDERLLMVFPEGARGTAKLFHERHSLVEFGTGFVRIALAARAPIVPFAFVGGGEAIPTMYNSRALGRLLGAPYVPVTPWLVAWPLPVRLDLVYGEPMRFDGSGNEEDEVIAGFVAQVKTRIGALIEHGRRVRAGEAGGGA
jgi:1-acyl-sn-glycerol-3-phosphate acyltransferase